VGIAFVEDGDVGGGHCCDVEEGWERRGRHSRGSLVGGGKFSYQAGGRSGNFDSLANIRV